MLLSARWVLSMQQPASLRLFPGTQDCRGQGMVAVEHSNKNLQVLSCLAPGNQQDAVGPGSRLVCSDFP